MKLDRQLRPATETSWVVSYGGKTIPRWRTAAILKIDISPYEKSSDFREILYTAADFELDKRHVIKNEKVALDRLRVRQNVFLVVTAYHHFWFFCTVNPLMGTLNQQSNGPLYSDRVIGTLAVDGWAVTFGTARRGLGGLRPRPVPSSLYQM